MPAFASTCGDPPKFRMIRAVAALLALSSFALADDVGDRVSRTFLKFDDLPLTLDDATNAGWTATGADCVPGLGIPYTADTLSEDDPIVLYLTQSGVFASFGVRVFEDLPPSLIPAWYKPVDTQSHEVSVSFRDPAAVCDPNFNPVEIIGDRVVVNQDTTAFVIPMDETDALNAGFVAGGCISGMGTHYSYDTQFAPKLTYNASTLMPVTPMYVNGSISAVLVSSPKEQGTPILGAWEGPFINSVWCYNWCADECSTNFGKDTSWWSSLHFMFHDHSLNSCDAHCP